MLAGRRKAEAKRQQIGSEHVIEFFHDLSDPYSQLLAQVMSDFVLRYRIQLNTHLVGPPDTDMTPEKECLAIYAREDAERLAKKAGIDFTFKEQEHAIQTEEADQLREKLGHYLGATLYYSGEWYWGLDRLHYLEERLTELGLRKDKTLQVPIFSPPDIPAHIEGATINPKPVIHFYCSFRSPYSAISASRIEALAIAYGAEIKTRYVLPMLMRELPVPKPKSNYIIKDAAREAHRLNIPFGKICDPLGKPVERGYSLMAWARKQGKDFVFAKAFMEMVWSQGVDASSNRGLKKIVEAAGLSWEEALNIVDNEDWREEAEANRLEMMEYKIWGVPSFRIQDTITWGQDRMWVVEDALREIT